MRFIHLCRYFLLLTVVCSPQQGLQAAGYAELIGITSDGEAQMNMGTFVLADVVVLDATGCSKKIDALKTKEWDVQMLEPDRHGRASAYIGSNRGELLQAELIRCGAALAYTARSHPKTAELARLPTAKRWVISSDDAGNHIGTVRQVRGRVLSVSVKPRQAFVNFGDDWKTDFTVTVPLQTLDAMTPEWFETMRGSTVWVNGFIDEYYGPRIMLHAPEMMGVIHGNSSATH